MLESSQGDFIMSKTIELHDVKPGLYRAPDYRKYRVLGVITHTHDDSGIEKFAFATLKGTEDDPRPTTVELWQDEEGHGVLLRYMSEECHGPIVAFCDENFTRYYFLRHEDFHQNSDDGYTRIKS